jgi:hypothetical protein
MRVSSTIFRVMGVDFPAHFPSQVCSTLVSHDKSRCQKTAIGFPWSQGVIDQDQSEIEWHFGQRRQMFDPGV